MASWPRSYPSPGPAPTASPRPRAAIQATVDASHLDGYWLHLDVDILDPGVMPAVDSPADGGLTPAELTGLLAALAPRAAGAQVTVFDPDLDPDGRFAVLLTDILTTGLEHLGQLAGDMPHRGITAGLSLARDHPVRVIPRSAHPGRFQLRDGVRSGPM